jgi:hypothetical protein
MNNWIAIGLILIGISIIYITYIDGKNRKTELTTGYIMHLNGYTGGIGLIFIGIKILINEHW